METLHNRLSRTCPEVAGFTLTVHELCADDHVQHEVRVFSESSPDNPALAVGCLVPPQSGEDEVAGRFDPLEFVQEAVAVLKNRQDDTHHSHSGPMPSYETGGTTVTRRYDCMVVFQDDIDPRIRGRDTGDDGEDSNSTGCC